MREGGGEDGRSQRSAGSVGRWIARAPYAVSIQNGGEVAELSIGGSLITEGDQVVTLQVQGRIGRIEVGGSVSAAGAGAEPVSIDGGTVDLRGVTIAS